MPIFPLIEEVYTNQMHIRVASEIFMDNSIKTRCGKYLKVGEYRTSTDVYGIKGLREVENICLGCGKPWLE